MRSTSFDYSTRLQVDGLGDFISIYKGTEGSLNKTDKLRDNFVRYIYLRLILKFISFFSEASFPSVSKFIPTKGSLNSFLIIIRQESLVHLVSII